MSEKDQEKLINDAPLDGAPHFDVAAPAFVPKEASEDVVVSEPGGNTRDASDRNEGRNNGSSYFRHRRDPRCG